LITEYEQKISAINHAGGNNPSDAASSAFAQVSDCVKPAEISDSEKVQPMKMPHAAATPAVDADVEMVEVVADAKNTKQMTKMVAVAV